ncbi:MAG TPA: hypothetical protein VHM91_23585 [Verrucomicrobiales bacterium]|nr:hypothetical protein [Verrucomicrobiales bacterium]
MRKTLNTLIPALALSLFSGVSLTQAGTYVSNEKNVVQTQPAPVEPCAGDISYNNIELLYAYTDFDDNGGGSGHSNGGKLNIEYSPFKNFYLTAGGEYYHLNNADLWIVNGGIGGYLPLTQHIHLAVDAGILWTDIEYDDDVFIGDNSDSDTGWYVRPHLRGKWGCFEAHAGALYRDMGDFNAAGEDGRWAGFAQLYYHLTPSLDLTAGVLCDEDLTQVNGGIRWRF